MHYTLTFETSNTPIGRANKCHVFSTLTLNSTKTRENSTASHQCIVPQLFKPDLVVFLSCSWPLNFLSVTAESPTRHQNQLELPSFKCSTVTKQP